MRIWGNEQNTSGNTPFSCILRWAWVPCLLAGIAAQIAPVFDLKQPPGLNFIQQNSPTPQKYLIETMPGGVALLDYNNDGLLDIFL